MAFLLKITPHRINVHIFTRVIGSYKKEPKGKWQVLTIHIDQLSG
nr:MAG TPA: hypothetical protein [Caudoviricetes sp.]